MKHVPLLTLWVVFWLFPLQSLADAPKSVGGFTLGASIDAYRDKLRMDTAFPIRYSEYLCEVEIKNQPGIKTGLIWYGTCAQPGRIVRIKLKYEDSTVSFYEALLKRFKARFGEPDEWRGDSFHVIRAWKWSFTDPEGRDISLILQHNTRDEEEKMGNSVKLTLWDFVEEEARCYRKRHPAAGETGEDSDRKPPPPVNWDLLVPE